MDVESSLLSYIDKNEMDIINLAVELMRFRVISPNAQYSEIIPFLERTYKKIRLEVKKVSASREKVKSLGFSYPRQNILGLLRGSADKPVLALFAHVDTVEVSDRELWHSDPLKPWLKDRKIYGLGAIDARCSLAAAFFAAKAIVRCGVKLRGSVLLMGTVDDEVGSDGLDWPGTPYLVKEGHAASGWGLPDLVVNCESSGLDEIWGCFKGRFTFEVDILGRKAHAGTPYGINALDKAFRFVEAVRSMPLKEHPIMGKDVIYQFAMVAGEDGHLDIPNKCHVGFDMRYVGGYDKDRARKYVLDTIEKMKKSDSDFRVGNLKIRRNLEPYEMGPNNKLVEAIRKSAEKVGIQAKYEGKVSAGQVYPYLKRGIGGVTYGAGRISRAHAIDEYIEFDELINQTKIYALLIKELCG